jgi:uncharacterized protein YfaS (alpha-2-macroglobulin family)
MSAGKGLGASDNQCQASTLVPVHVEIIDPQGRPAEYTGYYGAKDGQLAIGIDLAANDLSGRWTIRAHELASQQSQEHQLNVRAAK